MIVGEIVVLHTRGAQRALENIRNRIYSPLKYANSLMTPFFFGVIQVWSHMDNEALGIEYGSGDLREKLA